MQTHIKILLIFAMAFLFSCNTGLNEEEIVILPKPLIMEQARGVFRLDNPVCIHVADNELLKETASLFAEMIATSTGFELSIDNDLNTSRGIFH